MIGMTVCSGIGAPECAAPWIDWRYQSEIEKFPCAVLKARFSHAVNLGDMTKFQEWPDAVVDVLCGGTPCQSFSVAGLRKGLADPRGNLMLTYLAIAQRYQPRWLVWENVPGVLSSNRGRDFGTFLGALGQLGYGFAYRVLDAQCVRTQSHPWAVPQRRRRVFVVGYFGDWRRAAAVLLDPESLRGNPAPGRKAGQGSARGFETGPAGGGFADVAPTLDARCKDGPIRNQIGMGAPHPSTGDVSHFLNAGGMGRIDYETETFVTHALRGEGFDASEDGTGRGTPLVPCVAPTLRAGGNRTGGDRPPGTDVDTVETLVPVVAGPLSANGGTDKKHGFGMGQQDWENGYAVPVAIQERAVSENPNAGPDGAGIRQDGAAYTLEARTVPQAVATPWAVRRLTPLECERLQAFPDNWTLIPTKTKRQIDADELRRLRALSHEQMAELFNADPDGFVMPSDDDLRRLAADGPRYKALGNSMAVNVMNLIFERIREVDQQ